MKTKLLIFSLIMLTAGVFGAVWLWGKLPPWAMEQLAIALQNKYGIHLVYKEPSLTYIGLGKVRLRIPQAQIKQPKSYGKDALVDIDSVIVEMKLSEIIQHRVIEKVVLDIKTINIVYKGDVVNLDYLMKKYLIKKKNKKKKWYEKGAVKDQDEPKKSKILIHELEVHIGTVNIVFKDKKRQSLVIKKKIEYKEFTEYDFKPFVWVILRVLSERYGIKLGLQRVWSVAQGYPKKVVEKYSEKVHSMIAGGVNSVKHKVLSVGREIDHGIDKVVSLVKKVTK